MKFVLTVLTAIVVVGLVAPAVAVAENNIVVTLRGEGALIPSEDAPITDPDALCYETGLYDTKTDRLIGTGIDCLENADFDSNPPAVTLDRTTFFYFRQGTIAANGPQIRPASNGTTLEYYCCKTVNSP